jgi:predicted  nucleic acid-binding Zn-ribbon protein
MSAHVDRKVAVLETRVDWMHEAVTSIKDSTKEIAESTKQIALLEKESVESRQALARAFDSLSAETAERKEEYRQLRADMEECAEDMGCRLLAMEKELPLLKLSKSISFSLLGLAFLNMAAEVFHRIPK